MVKQIGKWSTTSKLYKGQISRILITTVFMSGSSEIYTDFIYKIKKDLSLTTDLTIQT